MLKINELALDAVRKALAATDNTHNLTEYPLSSREKVKVFAIILRRRLYFFTLKTLLSSVFSSKTLLFAVRADKGRRRHSPSAPSCSERRRHELASPPSTLASSSFINSRLWYFSTASAYSSGRPNFSYSSSRKARNSA